MMWWAWLAGTYKCPEDVRQFNDPNMAPTVQGGSDYKYDLAGKSE